MDFTVGFSFLGGVVIPDSITLKALFGRCGLANCRPDVESWGYEITHRGPRPLLLARFSRDMWWEHEIETVYQYLTKRRFEFALIEDLLATRLHPIHGPNVSNGMTLCLGSPVVGDINPLYQAIYHDKIRFSPFEGCASKNCCVLVAGFDGTPTPRSPHFPFPIQPFTRPSGLYPTPSDLNDS